MAVLATAPDFCTKENRHINLIANTRQTNMVTPTNTQPETYRRIIIIALGLALSAAVLAWPRPDVGQPKRHAPEDESTSATPRPTATTQELPTQLPRNAAPRPVVANPGSTSTAAEAPEPIEPKAPEHFFVSGWVVDTYGTPIANTKIYIQQKDPDSGKWRANNVAQNQRLPRSGPDGAFHLSTKQARARAAYRVRPWHREYVIRDSSPFEPGRTNLQVVMERAAQLEVQLLLPDGVRDGEVSGKLYPPRKKQFPLSQSAVSGAMVRMPEGVLTFGSLRGGDYLLALPSHPYIDVHVPPGKTTRLAQAVELRDKVIVVQMEVVDETGEPIEGAQVVRRMGNSKWTVKTGADGRWREALRAQNHRAELTVSKPGRCSLVQRDIQPFMRVVLPVAPIVRLQTPSEVWQAVGERRLFAHLAVPEEGAGDRGTSHATDSEKVEVQRNGATVIRAAGAGRFQVIWTVKDETTNWSYIIPSEPAQFVEVRIGDPPRDVEGQITAETIRKSARPPQGHSRR